MAIGYRLKVQQRMDSENKGLSISLASHFIAELWVLYPATFGVLSYRTWSHKRLSKELLKRKYMLTI
jgi:hypothetical protein